MAEDIPALIREAEVLLTKPWVWRFHPKRVMRRLVDALKAKHV